MTLRGVHEYATKLNIHTKHLSDVVKVHLDDHLLR